MNEGKVNLAALAHRHIEDAVQIHREGFPTFFLSQLGPLFLREFYASFLRDPLGIGFVAIDLKGRVIGVIVGPLDPRGYFSRLLKARWWAFCLASFSAALKLPSSVPRLLRAVSYRGEAPSGLVRALLSSIVVTPGAQKQGVGKLLMRAWVEEVRRRGAPGCYLTTDADRNEAVNSFYRRNGWRQDSSYLTREGRRMNRYILDW